MKKLAIVPAYVVHIKRLKETFVKMTNESSDLPPTVLIGKGTSCEAIIVAGSVDRDMGLQAAKVGFMAFQSDQLILAFDVFRQHLTDEKQTLEPGELQRRFEAGEDIGQAINVLHADRDGSVTIYDLLYSHRGKGTPFAWRGFNELHDGLSGFMVETARRIATDADGAQANFLRQTDEVAGAMGLEDRKLRHYHRSHVALTFLEELGFHCFDLRPNPYADKSGDENRPTADE